MSDNVEKYIKRKVYEKEDSRIAQRFVDAGLEKIRACINCGTCTGSCPSGRRTAYRTRSAIRKALTGDESVLQDIDIWLCTTCYYCYERCPRDIPVTDMIIKLRNIAVEEGYILDNHFNLADQIFYETGHGVPASGEAAAAGLASGTGSSADIASAVRCHQGGCLWLFDARRMVYAFFRYRLGGLEHRC